jgi:DNA-directed RNA polymerase alpha subunit
MPEVRRHIAGRYLLLRYAKVKDYQKTDSAQACKMKTMKAYKVTVTRVIIAFAKSERQAKRVVLKNMDEASDCEPDEIGIQQVSSLADIPKKWHLEVAFCPDSCLDMDCDYPVIDRLFLVQFKMRTRNQLRRNRIFSDEDLASKTEVEMQTIMNNKKCVNEIKEYLNTKGLRFIMPSEKLAK